MPKVVHYVQRFLSLTENWVYTQIINTKQYLPIILTAKRINEDNYPIKTSYSLENDLNDKSILFNKVISKLCKYNYYYYQCIKKESPDIIHAHFGNAAYEILNIKKKLNIPLITTFYGFDISMLPKMDKWLKRFRELFDEGDLFLVEGPYMAQSLIKLGCPKSKVKIHHLGINIMNLPFQPRSWDGDAPFKVLIAASFQEKKGIPYAIEALGRIQKEIPLEITIIGDSNLEKRSQIEKEKILKMIRSNNLTTRTRLLGYQPHSVLIDQAYKHHAFLSPSIVSSDGDTEGGAPVSIIEMAASGMPIISTNHCDIPEVIRHGMTGLLAEEKNVDQLVQNLRWLVTNRDWGRMLIASRQHIESEYDSIKQGIRLENIYREVTNLCQIAR